MLNTRLAAVSVGRGSLSIAVVSGNTAIEIALMAGMVTCLVCIIIATDSPAQKADLRSLLKEK